MTTNIKANKRAQGQSNKQLRKSGQIPCSMYGKSLEPIQIQISQQALQNCLRDRSPKISLEYNGKKYLASIEEAQKEPASGKLLHVSFHAFNQNEKVSMDIPVRLEGKAIGQTDGGILQQQGHTVCVYGPANELPEFIEINIAQLEQGASLHVSDIPVSGKYEIKESPDKVLVSCGYPKNNKADEEPKIESAETVDSEQPQEPSAEKEAA